MGMQYRITLSVALGLAIILSVFAYLAISALGQSKDAAAEERLVWARAVALHIDDVNQRTLAQVTRIARGAAHEIEEQDPYIEKDLEVFADSLFATNALLIDPNGTPIWSYSPTGEATVLDGPFLSLAETALQSGTATASPCPTDSPGGEALLCFASPVTGPDKQGYGVLAIQISTQRQELGFLFPPELGERAHVELVAADGRVIASSLAGDVDSVVHTTVLASYLAERKPGVVVHKMPSGSPIKTHIVAYAPVPSLPWGVAVEQDRDVALAASSRLQRKLLVFGLLTLVGAALLAWLDVRGVVRPLQMLTARAARMADGDLTTPIGLQRQDEVGKLAQSFEKMRSQLKTSLDEIERRDAELEERVQERTSQVERLYAELQAKEELRTHLLEKLISAQEEERARIARELHDEAGQSLTGIVMSVEAAASALPSGAAASQERLERAKALAQNTIEEIRKLVIDLRPAALDDLGLMPALRACAEERLADRGVKVYLEPSKLDQRLPGHVESCLFRVVQEAITNIARHAHAKSAHIRLRQNGRSLTLLVEDDGEGFDMTEVLGSSDKTRALGLLGMQERVALCGGSLRVESTPGRGTRVQAEIPLAEGNGK